MSPRDQNKRSKQELTCYVTELLLIFAIVFVVSRGKPKMGFHGVTPAIVLKIPFASGVLDGADRCSAWSVNHFRCERMKLVCSFCKTFIIGLDSRKLVIILIKVTTLFNANSTYCHRECNCLQIRNFCIIKKD